MQLELYQITERVSRVFVVSKIPHKNLTLGFITHSKENGHLFRTSSHVTLSSEALREVALLLDKLNA